MTDFSNHMLTFFDYVQDSYLAGVGISERVTTCLSMTGSNKLIALS